MSKHQTLQQNPGIVNSLSLNANEKRFVTCSVVYNKTNNVEYKTETFKAIASMKGKPMRWGSDDDTYKYLGKNFIKEIPRAFSRLYIKNQDTDDYVHIFTMRGVAKFDGITAGDEDPNGEIESIPTSQHGLVDEDDIKSWMADDNLIVEFQEKANGKMAVFTIIIGKDGWYIYGGSKNRHVLIYIGEIGKFITPVGDNLHICILKSIVGDLSKLSHEEIKLMENKTFVGEYVDGKHMVYTDKPYMVYFVRGAEVSLPAITKVFPDQTVMPSVSQMQKIRRMKTEGCVIVYRNTNTGQTYRHKLKTIWYTVIRCWREIIKTAGKRKMTIKDIIDTCVERMCRRSEQFLNMKPKEIRYYKMLANDFIWYISESCYSYSDIGFTNVGIGKVYHEFVESGGLKTLGQHCRNVVVDEKKNVILEAPAAILQMAHPFALMSIKQICKNNPLDIDSRSYVAKTLLVNVDDFYTILKIAPHNKVAVIMQGPPGSGKSTIANLLKQSCDYEHVSCSIHTTDDYFGIGDDYKFDVSKLGKYHSANKRQFDASKKQVKICANTNTTYHELIPYVNSAHNNGYVVIILTCKSAVAEILARRSEHNVPLWRIKKMVDRIQVFPCMYTGLFINPVDLPNDNRFVFNQKTPLHMTISYVGNNPIDNIKAYDNYIRRGPGSSVNIEIIGVSDTYVGRALVIKTDIKTEAETPHITMSVNAGYKPGQISESITVASTTLFDEPMLIQAHNALTW
jgi:hypothetical protein